MGTPTGALVSSEQILKSARLMLAGTGNTFTVVMLPDPLLVHCGLELSVMLRI